MSDTSVIREFLVALGVKVDDPGIKRFSDGVDKATKVAAQLATGVEAMAVAVGAAVAKVSAKFEDLYYASQRIGASVENIRGFDFAIGQLGGTAGAAQQALENMGEFFRSNPGAERFIAGLGVETRDANGDLRDMTGIMHDLGGALRGMPYYRAKVVAGVLGIDPRTLQAMLRDTGEAQARYHELAQRMGVDQQAAAKASHDFMNDLRELLAVVTLAADRVMLAIQPFADRVVKWLEALDEKTQGWSTALIGLGIALAPILALVDPLVIAVGALAAGIVALTVDFENWRDGADTFVDWKSWSDEIDHALKALKTLGGGIADLVTAIGSLSGAWGREETASEKALDPAKTKGMRIAIQVLIDMVDALGNSLKVVADLLTGQWGKAWEDAKKVGHDLKDPRLAVMARSPTGELGDGPSAQARAQAQAPARAANQNQPGAAAASAAVRGAAKAASDHVLAFFESNGFTHAQARGMAAGVSAESQSSPTAVNPKSGAFGIGQWLGPRKAELFRRYGQHPTLNQQLEFMLWELNGGDRGGAAVRGARSAGEALDAYVRRFMRPADGRETLGDLSRGAAYLQSQVDRPALASAGPTVSVNQKTEINVHGVSDPHQAGRAAAGEQDRVNGQLVRDLKTAVS